MTGKTEKQICRGDFWKQSMEDTGWEVYASRILCVVKRISEKEGAVIKISIYIGKESFLQERNRV